MAARSFFSFSERLFFPKNTRSTNAAAKLTKTMQYSTQSSNPKTVKENNDDAPIKFTASAASSWNSEDPNYHKYRTNKPKYEHTIVQLSLAAFLIYFCVLREESDWDVGIFDDIFSKVPDLELVSLREKKKEAEKAGLPFSEENLRRLKELEKQLAVKK